MDAAEVLTTTRTVRRRLDLNRPVDIDVVRDCVRVAQQAPNGGDREASAWIVITDPVLREKVGVVYRAAFTARHRDAGDGRLVRSARHLAENMGRVPVLVLPCVRVPGGRFPAGSQASLWGSVLPAAWSYMLAARAAGLAAAWTTVHLDAEDEVAAILGLPADVRQGALIPTAHPIGDGFRPARRRPLGDVLHLNQWTEAQP
ncbi:nitroreductase family protein [Streptomyces durmitorensis]|uniref:Nitroreductase family protein n=1 Tax=Streptomyces durmitorensis TaxID=319947 RepID=A0ABY4Q796_9ACTN|nr:nitroreductase family protein [Streptomyces durmitorensis]UQT61996.1 nitroreductase family protein [Streptomyces durmitorensis]